MQIETKYDIGVEVNLRSTKYRRGTIERIEVTFAGISYAVRVKAKRFGYPTSLIFITEDEILSKVEQKSK